MLSGIGLWNVLSTVVKTKALVALGIENEDPPNSVDDR